VDLGTGSHFEGTILAIAGINMQTGASINGRLLAQTAVTLDANAVTAVSASPVGMRLQSTAALTDSFTDAAGQSIILATLTITVPQNGNTQFYRIVADTELTLTNITVSGGSVVIKYNYAGSSAVAIAESPLLRPTPRDAPSATGTTAARPRNAGRSTSPRTSSKMPSGPMSQFKAFRARVRKLWSDRHAEANRAM